MKGLVKMKNRFFLFQIENILAIKFRQKIIHKLTNNKNKIFNQKKNKINKKNKKYNNLLPNLKINNSNNKNSLQTLRVLHNG